MLNQVNAKKELQKFNDPTYVDFIGKAATVAISIQNSIDGWANSLEKCCESISPISTSLEAAVDAFRAIAELMYADPTGGVFQAAVAGFCDVLGGGMTGYTTTSPPNPLIISGANPTNPELACDTMALQLVNYLKTGKAKNIITNVEENWS